MLLLHSSSSAPPSPPSLTPFIFDDISAVCDDRYALVWSCGGPEGPAADVLLKKLNTSFTVMMLNVSLRRWGDVWLTLCHRGGKQSRAVRLTLCANSGIELNGAWCTLVQFNSNSIQFYLKLRFIATLSQNNFAQTHVSGSGWLSRFKMKNIWDWSDIVIETCSLIDNSAKGMLKAISPFQGTHTIWPTPMIIFPKRSRSSPDLTCSRYLIATYLLGKCKINTIDTSSGSGLQNKGCKGSHLPFLTQKLFCGTYRTTFNI